MEASGHDREAPGPDMEAAGHDREASGLDTEAACHAYGGLRS